MQSSPLESMEKSILKYVNKDELTAIYLRILLNKMGFLNLCAENMPKQGEISYEKENVKISLKIKFTEKSLEKSSEKRLIESGFEKLLNSFNSAACKANVEGDITSPIDIHISKQDFYTMVAGSKIIYKFLNNATFIKILSNTDVNQKLNADEIQLIQDAKTTFDSYNLNIGRLNDLIDIQNSSRSFNSEDELLLEQSKPVIIVDNQPEVQLPMKEINQNVQPVQLNLPEEQPNPEENKNQAEVPFVLQEADKEQIQQIVSDQSENVQQLFVPEVDINRHVQPEVPLNQTEEQPKQQIVEHNLQEDNENNGSFDFKFEDQNENQSQNQSSVHSLKEENYISLNAIGENKPQISLELTESQRKNLAEIYNAIDKLEKYGRKISGEEGRKAISVAQDLRASFQKYEAASISNEQLEKEVTDITTNQSYKFLSRHGNVKHILANLIFAITGFLPQLINKLTGKHFGIFFKGETTRDEMVRDIKNTMDKLKI